MERRKALVIAASVATTAAGGAGVMAVNAGLIGATQAQAADKVGQLDARNVSTLLPAKPSKPRVVLRPAHTLPPQVTVVYEDVPAPTAPQPPALSAGRSNVGAGPQSAPARPMRRPVPSTAPAQAPTTAPARTSVPTTTAAHPVVHTGASSTAPSGTKDDGAATPEVEHNDD